MGGTAAAAAAAASLAPRPPPTAARPRNHHHTYTHTHKLCTHPLIATPPFAPAEEVCTIAAMVSIGGAVFYRPKDKAVHADNAHKAFHRGGVGARGGAARAGRGVTERNATQRNATPATPRSPPYLPNPPAHLPMLPSTYHTPQATTLLS